MTRTAAGDTLPAAPPAGAGAMTNPASQQVVVFSVLWSVAHLAHLLRKADPGSVFVWLLLIAAILVLGNPRSRLRLGMLAGIQLVYLFTKLPVTDNHMIIMGFVNLGVLVAVLMGGRRAADSGVLPGAAVAYIRLTIVIAYGAAALAKLNHGFFDVVESCAVSMFYDATAVLDGRVRVPDIPQAIEAALPFVIAGTELLIPVLLLIPATRAFGVGVVVLFHLGMSLSPSSTAIDFTIVLFALVFLFLPAPAGVHLTGRALGLLPQRLTRIKGARPMGLIAVAVLAGSLVAGVGTDVATWSGNRNWLVLAPVAVGLGALLLDAAWRAVKNRWPRAAPIWPPGPVLSVSRLGYLSCVVLLVATAASPYMGGKTRSVFTMYSNLQTEQMTSNHLLFPRLPMATGQDDLVLVMESSNARLNRIGAGGRLVTWHELRRELAGDPEASIRYERAGEVVEHAQALENPELVSRHPVSHRFIAHRIVDPERARCLW
ncbi:HTTM domain-containing protein [Phytoactinopolyspora mesophila]|uniref:HTTM domain-containing protein n=1 Tax=Phytoactinopolyspora mesophila TaxID=2650750 RepID=A0A7K3M196_9ACTN|nr:HTTM domain-containing protein [Phytoactinopolyspora mesophila]NDL57073.1 hypothetical protein [Phytoactinopolyspora mesophila]